MELLTSHAALFVSALLSATLLPGSSEAVLLGLLGAGISTPTALIATASIGNITGACLNWLLGSSFQRFKSHRWFPLDDSQNTRARAVFARYGTLTLLLSWVPIIGDPLTLIAGMMRVHFGKFILLVAIGKIARYVFIVASWQLLTDS